MLEAERNRRNKKVWQALNIIFLICVLTEILDTLRSRQNGPHFPDDILMNENVLISIKMLLEFTKSTTEVPMTAIQTYFQWVINFSLDIARSFYEIAMYDRKMLFNKSTASLSKITTQNRKRSFFSTKLQAHISVQSYKLTLRNYIVMI